MHGILFELLNIVISNKIMMGCDIPLNHFRVGEKVRIRETTGCEFAGFLGEIISTRSTVCDVKIIYTLDSLETDIFVGVFPQDELEIIQRN